LPNSWKLAREIAGDTEDPILLARARTIAQAELDLAQVRLAKVALIERASRSESSIHRGSLATSPKSSVSLIQLTEVDPSFPKPSTLDDDAVTRALPIGGSRPMGAARTA
jgi:hypothetical protein